MKKIISVAFLLVLILGGCTSSKEDTNDESGKTVDTLNGSVQIDEVPKNVVSLDLMYTEVLLKLGITPIGATTSSDFSEEFPYYINESLQNSNTQLLQEDDTDFISLVKGLEPDLIIGSSYDESFYDELNKIAPTIIIDEDQINSWEDVMQGFGKVFEKTQEAENITKDYDARIENINNRLNSSIDDYNNSTAMYIDLADGELNYIDETFLYTSLKFKQISSLTSSVNQKVITMDELLEIDPDYLIIGTKTINDITNFMDENKEFENLKAYKNNHYYEVDPKLWDFGFGPISENLKLNQIEEFINN